jgi:hypothetical protein
VKLINLPIAAITLKNRVYLSYGQLACKNYEDGCGAFLINIKRGGLKNGKKDRGCD